MQYLAQKIKIAKPANQSNSLTMSPGLVQQSNERTGAPGTVNKLKLQRGSSQAVANGIAPGHSSMGGNSNSN